MPYLGNDPGKLGTVLMDSFTGNGSTVAFTLGREPPNSDALIVTVDGVVQHPTGAWSISANILTFSTAPDSSAEIRVWHLSSTASGGLTSLVADTTPQLGGQLDVNGNAIGDGTLELLKFAETGSAVNELTITNAATGNPPALSATGGDANINLKLAGKGTGGLEIGATATTASKLILAEDTDNGAHTITVAAPAAVTGDITLTLPDGDGDADQFLQTNGSGVLSWAAAAAGGGYTEGCRILAAGAQSIANNTYTDLIFGASPRYDTDTMTDQTNNTTSTKITFTTAGVYVVWGSVWWVSDPTNQGLSIFLNGSTEITRVRNDGTNQRWEIATTVWKFDADDYVTLRAMQESGAAKNTSKEYGSFASEFAAQRIG